MNRRTAIKAAIGGFLGCLVPWKAGASRPPDVKAAIGIAGFGFTRFIIWSDAEVYSGNLLNTSGEFELHLDSFRVDGDQAAIEIKSCETGETGPLYLREIECNGATVEVM